MNVENEAQLPRLNILFSYYYLREQSDTCELLEALAPYINVLIDSGAFTDFSQRRKAAARGHEHQPIRNSDYIAWLKEHGHLWWQYIQLDVIRNPDQSRYNFHEEQRAGLNPMAVFTYPEKLSAIPELIESNKHLCVSGGTDAARDFMHQRFQRIHEASEGAALTHGLAFVKWPDIYQLPIYSVDSSTWTSGKRFGNVSRFDARRGMMAGAWQKVLSSAPDPATIKHLRACNITREILQTRAKPHWDTNDGIAGSVTTNAHLQFHADAYSRQRLYFLVAVCAYQLLEIAACASAQLGAGLFDYQLALERVLMLKREWRESKAESMRHCVELVRDNTRWQERAA